MFMSLLSMTLYKRVVCHYLISGHSHMMPDRVVSHTKKSFGTNNLYLPEEMIEKMSSIATVNAEFIDHSNPDRHIYTGWEKLLKVWSHWTSGRSGEVGRGRRKERVLCYCGI